MKIRIHAQAFGAAEANTDAPPINIKVENDWLYAVYLWVAAAIAGKVSVSGLDMFEDAVEKRFFEALQDNAVRMSIRAEFVSVQQGTGQAFQFDVAASPHLYLPLIVLAAHANGNSVLSSIQSSIDLNPELWQHRLEVLQALGLDLKLQDGLLIIKKNEAIKNTTVNHTQDAELLMAISILALRANDSTTIHDAHLIASKFPNFISDCNQLLARKIEILES